MRPLVHLALWVAHLEQGETQTTDAERKCLVKYATGKRRLVEIGVWHGVTTSLLRSVMDPAGRLLAVDPFRPGRLGFSIQRLIARREVARSDNGTVEWVRLPGDKAGHEYRQTGGEPIDFVFIDGDHSYEAVQGDWEAWTPLLTSGGIVALHDSRATPDREIASAGSALFTRAIVLKHRDFVLMEEVDSLTILRRR